MVPHPPDSSTRPAPCKYSGLAVLSCKVSDLCDCFDYPEFEQAALDAVAAIEARRSGGGS